MTECTVHLISLEPDATPNQVTSQLKAANQSVFLSGVPHGWIHKPHTNNVDQLLGSEWLLFVLTQAQCLPLRLHAFDGCVSEFESRQRARAGRYVHSVGQ